MNVYDFDGTIYDGDSTVDFYFYCFKKNPSIIKYLPKQIKGMILYYFKKINKTQMKEYFYSFFEGIKNIDQNVKEFWNRNGNKIKNWYLKQQNEDDVIISASPYFLLFPICENIGIHEVIASNVNKKTGKYEGENCKGEEKVKRFFEKFESGRIDEFYSDSYTDTPLAEISNKAFLVKKEKIIDFFQE